MKRKPRSREQKRCQVGRTATTSFDRGSCVTPHEPEHIILVSNRPGFHRISEAVLWLSRGHYVWDFYGNPIFLPDISDIQLAPASTTTANMVKSHPSVTFQFEISDHPNAFSRQIRQVDGLAHAMGMAVFKWPKAQGVDYRNLPRHGPLEIESRPMDTLSRAEVACRYWLIDQERHISRSNHHGKEDPAPSGSTQSVQIRYPRSERVGTPLSAPMCFGRMFDYSCSSPPTPRS
jgi:hypothetical protein